MFKGVYAASTTDVWVVGAGGLIRRYDGTSWSAFASGVLVDLTFVWGTSGSDVYVGGEMGYIRHWNGSAWTNLTGGGASSYSGIWASPSQRFAVGYFTQGLIQFYGGGWQTMQTQPSRLNAIRAASVRSLWAVGVGGTILRYTGYGWLQELTPPTQYDIRGLWLLDASYGWSVGAGPTVYRYSNNAFVDYSWPGSTWLNAVTGDGPGRAFGVGFGGEIIRWDGSSWTTMTSPTTSVLNDVSMRNDLGAVDVWAVGDKAYHNDGTAGTWTPYITPCGNLNGVHVQTPGTAWAVGNRICRWDGATWAEVSNPAGGWLGAVHGPPSSTAAWAVGTAGRIVSYDGVAWNLDDSPTSENLSAVHAAASDDVWAVGNAGTVMHWDGTSWDLFRTSTPLNLFAVQVVPSEGLVLMVGEDGVNLRLVYSR
jgi:hypothetical protein